MASALGHCQRTCRQPRQTTRGHIAARNSSTPCHESRTTGHDTPPWRAPLADHPCPSQGPPTLARHGGENLLRIALTCSCCALWCRVYLAFLYGVSLLHAVIARHRGAYWWHDIGARHGGQSPCHVSMARYGAANVLLGYLALPPLRVTIARLGGQAPSQEALASTTQEER